VSLAQKIAESVNLRQGEEYRTQHFIGLTGKYVTSTLAQQYTASTYAMDAGYQMHMPERGIDFGLSVMNLGGKLTYVSEGDPLPTTYRGGAAYTMRNLAGGDLLLAASGEYRAFEKDYRYGLGVEYEVAKTYYLRGGWRIESDAGGPTFGFGFREGAWQIDYGYETGRVFTSQHRFSLVWRFRAPWSRPERRKRAYIEELDLPKKIDERRIETPAQQQEKPQPIERGVPGWIY
jgi:hypothetical protein